MTVGFKNYATRVNEMEVLGDEACASLIRKYKESNSSELLDRITRSYLRLVMKIANEYKGMGVDLDELVALGNVGLLEAIKKYDVDKGAKFSVYAGYWIRLKMRREGLDRQHVVRKGEHYRNKKKGVSNINISLDEKISEDDDRMIGDVLESDTDSPSDEIEREDTYSNMFEAIDSNILTDIERNILKARYGLKSGQKKKLVQLGAEMNYSRERIRQLEKSAIAKLRVALGISNFDDCEKDIIDDADADNKGVGTDPVIVNDFIIKDVVEPKNEPPIEIKNDNKVINEPIADERPKNAMSLLEAAIKVLEEEKRALTVGMMVDMVKNKGYWTEGKSNNPSHVLYAWIMYDIKKHGEKAKFCRSGEKGKFCLMA